MAAQARHYEKSIAYSSRQVDDKYISKNRHNSHLKSSSRESSPYRGGGKASSHSSSPGGRKRPYNSPNSSAKLSNSPYESIRKKDRIENEMGKNECENSIDARSEDDETGMKRSHCHRCPVNGYIKDDTDWSQHLSSSGKIYYYNKQTEKSQWEVPKGWNDRDQELKEPVKERSARESLNFSKESNSREDFREVRDPRETKDYKYKEKANSKDYRPQDSRSYNRDSRKNREKESREFWDNFKDRDYRERDSRDYNDGKHRVAPGSSKRVEVKYNSPSIRTVGQSTPTSSTSHSSRSYRRPTPDSLNGSESVQDISPPGTPTNDDIVNISTMSPAPLYTPHSCSPHISATHTTSRLPHPTTPHTPLLSPILLNSSGHLSTSYLHPLQQALLLQQQQATTNKDIFGSPKLPTVKNHIHPAHSVGTTPTSPMTSSNQKPVPMVHSPDLSSRNSQTPPPPPPPLKDHNRMTDSKDRNCTKQERQSMQTPTHESRSEQHENINRSKTHEYQPGDTPVKTSYKTFNSERLIKKTIKLEKEENIVFPPLPDLNIYSEHFSPSVADFNTSFYCTALENQISAVWEETMNLLHSEGYRSKFNLSICRQHADSQDSKLDVSSRWVDALNTVILKVESLQDSSMKSEARVTTRETKSPATRKIKSETNSESTNENGEKSDTKNSLLNTKVKDTTITKPNTTIIKPNNTSPLIVDTEDVLRNIGVMIERSTR